METEAEEYVHELRKYRERLLQFAQSISRGIEENSNQDLKTQENQVLDLLEKAHELSLQLRKLARRCKNREPSIREYLEMQADVLSTAADALKTYFRKFVAANGVPPALVLG